MELPKYTKLIDDIINDKHAMSLLFETYQATPETEKDKFVLALIGHTVISHNLLEQALNERTGH